MLTFSLVISCRSLLGVAFVGAAGRSLTRHSRQRLQQERNHRIHNSSFRWWTIRLLIGSQPRDHHEQEHSVWSRGPFPKGIVIAAGPAFSASGDHCSRMGHRRNYRACKLSGPRTEPPSPRRAILRLVSSRVAALQLERVAMHKKWAIVLGVHFACSRFQKSVESVK